MTRVRHGVLAGLALAVPLSAQAPPPPWAARIDEIFAPYAAGASPGCAVAVIRDGAIAYEKGYGLASLEHAVPIAPDTVFDIGSVSKQFTAAAVLLLAKDGKLSLDDDVRKWIPELPDYRAKIAIRHLFHHTSGIRDYTDLLALAGARTPDRTTKEEALAMVVRQRGLDFPPGTDEAYSNSGYFLLSVIVERAAGKGLNDFARERIFQPLGMADTQFLDDSRRVVQRKASGYAPREGGGFRLAGSNWEQIGDGSLLTTVRDLAKWVGNFEDPKLGGPDFVAAMEEVGALADGTKLEYASGLRVDAWRGLRRVWHGGAWAGYRAALVRFPSERTALAATCNRGDAPTADLIARAAEIVLDGRLGPAASPAASGAKAAVVPVAPSEAERVEGAYFEPSRFWVRRIERKDGGLVYRRGEAVTPLRPDGPGGYRLAIGEPAFEVRFRPAGERAESMQMRQGRRTFDLRRVHPWRPSASELALYAGEFESEELDARFSIVLEGGRLVLHRRGGDPTPLTPLFWDAFENDDVGVILFPRTARPTPPAFHISNGRSQIRFVRRKS